MANANSAQLAIESRCISSSARKLKNGYILSISWKCLVTGRGSWLFKPWSISAVLFGLAILFGAGSERAAATNLVLASAISYGYFFAFQWPVGMSKAFFVRDDGTVYRLKNGSKADRRSLESGNYNDWSRDFSVEEIKAVGHAISKIDPQLLLVIDE